MEEIKIGVIGGSGLYDMPEITNKTRHQIKTPFGDPSGDIVVGTLRGKRVAFLPRHGEGHIYPPSEIPQRANIYALKSLGVRFIIAVNACGSLRAEIKPGHVVVPDQLVDYTLNRGQRTFFDQGIAAHISVAEPFDSLVQQLLVKAISVSGGTVHDGGSFIIEDGPRFATRAESHIFRSWGCDIIGMTTVPEAFLAREAEMGYATMAHITDYDSWHETEEPVTVDIVMSTFSKNIELIQNAIAYAVENIDEDAVTASHRALDYAVMTQPDKIPNETMQNLKLLLARSLGL